MARQELVSRNEVRQGRAALDLAAGEEALGGRDEEDMVVDGRTLCGDGAPRLEEGG